MAEWCRLQPLLNRNVEIARRERVGLRPDDLMPDALKSEAQKLADQYDPAELIDGPSPDDPMRTVRCTARCELPLM